MVTIEQAAASAPRFYLASRSPRRRELLTQAGFAYAELPPGAADVDETPQADEAPVDYVLRVAREKAAAGWRARTACTRAVRRSLPLGHDRLLISREDHSLEMLTLKKG